MTSAIGSGLVFAGRSTWKSNLKTSYGTARLRNSMYPVSRWDSTRFRNSELARTPSTSGFARTYPRFFAKEDLPEPKKPEIQTPTLSFGDPGDAAIAENR